MPQLPDRAVLRAAYDAAIREIDQSRGKSMLTTAFYASVGDAVFDTCYRALTDHCAATEHTGLNPPPKRFTPSLHQPAPARPRSVLHSWQRSSGCISKTR